MGTPRVKGRRYSGPFLHFPMSYPRVERGSSNNDNYCLLKARWGSAAWKLRSEEPWNACLCSSGERRKDQQFWRVGLSAGGSRQNLVWCPSGCLCWAWVLTHMHSPPTETGAGAGLPQVQLALWPSRTDRWSLKDFRKWEQCLYVWGKREDRACYTLSSNFTKIFKPASPQRSLRDIQESSLAPTPGWFTSWMGSRWFNMAIFSRVPYLGLLGPLLWSFFACFKLPPFLSGPSA